MLDSNVFLVFYFEIQNISIFQSRFLRTIDPDEVEEASQRPLTNVIPTSPPINPSANEEEISLLIGTLQVPRGRSSSKISPKDVIAHR